ncbi:unnamed protein product [Boreogadus saida]
MRQITPTGISRQQTYSFITMATVWFLFAVLCIATAAPAVKGGKQGVAVVKSEAAPVLAAVVPKAGEADLVLRRIEEELKQKEGVLKAVVMAAAPSEKAMKEVGEPLVEHTNELQDPQSEKPEDSWSRWGARVYVWIGSYFLQTRWRWIDGTGMYYQEFISPSSSTSSACTCLRTSGWAKASCSTNMRFICSTSPGSC